MHAFVRIIEELIAATPPQAWLTWQAFPFPHLPAPKATVFDACVFDSPPSDAMGFLWLAFEGTEDVLAMPFRLARYSEDGDLITLPPWSLRDASTDVEFYARWRTAQKAKGHLVTIKQGILAPRKFAGEPSFVAVGMKQESISTSVRLDMQVAYKIFRTFSVQHPQSLEVEFLSYLSTQNTFHSFAPLLTTVEYTGQGIKNAHVAVIMRYIQNNGHLKPLLSSLIYRARFPKQLEHSSAQQAWAEALSLSSLLGRTLGEFHSAMALAPRSSLLAPEPPHEEQTSRWLQTMEQVADMRLNTLQALNTGSYGGQEYLELGERLQVLSKELQKRSHDLGVRIQVHGSASLNQFLLASDGELVLLEYESDSMDPPQYRLTKQSCYKDVAGILASLRFCWYEVSTKPPRGGDFVTPQPAPRLELLEQSFLKSYHHTVEEAAATAQIRPRDPETAKYLLEFYFILRALKENIRSVKPIGNPKLPLWKRMLTDMIIQDFSWLT